MTAVEVQVQRRQAGASGREIGLGRIGDGERIVVQEEVEEDVDQASGLELQNVSCCRCGWAGRCRDARLSPFPGMRKHRGWEVDGWSSAALSKAPDVEGLRCCGPALVETEDGHDRGRVSGL